MRIDIEMLSGEGRNCLEVAAVSVAKWLGLKYELIFSEAWGFIYNPPEGIVEGIIGKYLDSDWGEVRKYAEEYIGLGLDIHEEKAPEEYVSIVMRELEAGMPALVYLDVFWCPWMTSAYQKKHQGHYCLAVGYQEDGTLDCLDAAANYMEFKLPQSDMQNGCQRCITFAKKPELETLDWRIIIENTYAKLQGSNAFQAMRDFAVQLAKIMDIQIETEGCENGWGAPLITETSRIRRGREQFAKVLNCISVNFDVKEYGILSERLMEVSNLWNRICTLLSMAFYEPGVNDSVRKEIGEIIQECAQLEEDIAEKMVKVSRGIHTVVSDDSKKVSSVTYLDISRYFNNNAFAADVSEEVKANFTVEGEYFLTEGLPEGREWEIKDMKFLVPAYSEGVEDNILTEGQTIEVPSTRARGLMILGCGVGGDYSESIALEYSDGTTGEVPVDFTNWFFEPRYYGELVAWKGNAVIKKEGRAELLDYGRRIFAKTYWLKKEGEVTGIRLPTNKNIHLFAISLAE